MDRAVTDASPSASHASDEITGLEVNVMTNQMSNSCAETETVCSAVDKERPSNQTQSDANSLTELSVPETRSVYEVDGDPLALEPKDGTLEHNLCIPEVTEPQTSDKHTDSQLRATSQETKKCTEIKDTQTAPEFLKSPSQTEDQPEDKTCDIARVTEGGIVDEPSQCQETKPPVYAPLVAHRHESKDQFSPPEMISAHLQSCVSETVETNIVETKQMPPVVGASEPSAQSILATSADSMEVISENKDQKDDSVFASCTQTLKVQQSEAVFVHPNITNPNQADGFLKTSDVDHKCTTVVGASNHAGYKRHRPSFAWDTVIKNKMNTHAKCADKNSKPSLALTPSTSSKSEQRSSGFLNLELLSPFSAPRFTNKGMYFVFYILCNDTIHKSPKKHFLLFKILQPR